MEKKRGFKPAGHRSKAGKDQALHRPEQCQLEPVYECGEVSAIVKKLKIDAAG